MSYKVFQNGFPLPASDLNNYLMNQSVIAFASSTERDSTLTSPIEGQLTYLEDTNSYTYFDGADWQSLVSGGTPIESDLLTTTGDVIYASAAETPARLGIGSEGEVLTVTSGVPTWEALPSAGTITWDFVGNTTPTTGVSSITITGLTGYKKYLLRFNAIKSSSACYWNMKVNNVDYTFNALRLVGDGSSARILTSSNYIARTSNSTTTALSGEVYVEFNSAEGNGHYIITTGSNGTSSTDENYIGNFIVPAPTTSIVIQLSAGTVSSGTYSIYGGN